MVVEQHAPQLQRLRVVLVEQQRLLEALGGRLKVAQFPVESTESRTQWAPRRVQNGAPSWGPTCGETGVPVLAAQRPTRHLPLTFPESPRRGHLGAPQILGGKFIFRSFESLSLFPVELQPLKTVCKFQYSCRFQPHRALAF